jgi:hypothetical protein
MMWVSERARDRMRRQRHLSRNDKTRKREHQQLYYQAASHRDLDRRGLADLRHLA